MSTVLTVDKWIASLGADEFVDYAASPVAKQLQQLDDVGTGIGFIYYLIPMLSETSTLTETSRSVPGQEELHITPRAVFKIRGKWFVTADDNISEIAISVVRIIVQGIDPNDAVEDISIVDQKKSLEGE